MSFFSQLLLPIVWHVNSACDVMIFDEDGSGELFNCIPSGATVNILKIRQGRPMLKSLRFFVLIFINLIKYKNISMAQYAAIINIWKPKILITYIDNSFIPGNIQKIFPNLFVLSVQNGFRGDLSQANIPNKFGYYFSFGSMELDLFSCQKYEFKKVYQVGSLRAGLANEKHNKEKLSQFDICFISEYMTNDELLKCNDTWSRDFLAMCIPAEKAFFNLVAKFAQERNLKLCVAMRNGVGNPSFEEERNFFLLNGGNQVVLTPRINLSSYSLVLNSRLSVCLFSTLGYEALGLCKKVIFASDCKDIKDFFMRDVWRVNYSAHKMPDLIKLQKMEYAEFHDKAVNLLEMPNEEYLQQTKIARRYYMNIDFKIPPQISIKNEITRILAKSI